MEVTPSPAKKLCTVRMTECVREFKLPRQYPSMVKSQEKNVVLKASDGKKIGNVTVKLGNVIVPNAVKLSATKDLPTNTNMQKLRIKLPNGKDLGEFNVALVPWKNSFMPGKVMLQGQKICNPVKPVSVAVVKSPANVNNAPSPPEVVQSSTSVEKQDDSVHANVLKEDNLENKKNMVRSKPIILSKRVIPAGKRCLEVVEEKSNAEIKDSNATVSSTKEKIDKDSKTPKDLLNGGRKFIKIPQNLKTQKLFVLEQNGSHGNLKKDIAQVIKNGFGISNVKDSNGNGNAKVQEYQKIGNSLYPIVKRETIIVPLVENNKLLNKKKCSVESNSSQPTSQKEFIETAVQYLYKKKTALKNNVNTQEKMVTDVPAENNNCKTSGQTKPNKRKFGDNVMVMLHEHRTAWLNESNNVNKLEINQSTSNNTNSMCALTAISSVNTTSPSDEISPPQGTTEPSSTLNEKDKCSSCNKSNPEINVNEKQKVDASSPDSTLAQEQSNETRDIIQKAINSVKDEKLRVEALKALAACGIIAEREVPLSPKANAKIVRDSGMQTSVFSLLEPDSFVLVSETNEDVVRVNQKEKSISNAGNCEQTDRVNVENIQDEYVKEFDLTFLTDFLKDNEGASKVKNIFVKPNQRCSNVVSQLKVDFETALEYDEEGLLNIHKAVIKNRINDVQRQLMVLQARKADVDIKSLDGRTSLELAIEFDASHEIVLVLLKAGAQPVSDEPSHESAILLASKKRSRILAQLVKAADRDLLNVFDSTGFAAIHYCAQLGDLEGISALIEADANVNLKDGRSGRTALFHAVEHKNLTVAQKLLDNGALGNIPNFAGQMVSCLVEETKSLYFRTSFSKR